MFLREQSDLGPYNCNIHVGSQSTSAHDTQATFVENCDIQAYVGYCCCRAYPSSEFVVASTLAKWKKLEPNEIAFSQGLARK